MVSIHCVACRSPIPLHAEAYGEFDGELGCPVCGSALRLVTEKTGADGQPKVVRLSLAMVVEVNTA
jgi:uncharacterized Zn finger protein (UPF0148 family)